MSYSYDDDGDDEGLSDFLRSPSPSRAASLELPIEFRRARDPLGNPMLGMAEEPERETDDVVRQLVTTRLHRRNVNVNTGGNIRAAAGAGAQSICDVYSNEGYDCMIQDTKRNAAYEQGVAAAGARRWLEIGPGPALTLTQLVWRAHRNAHVVAVEVNKGSAQTALKKARDMGHARDLTLLQGYSTSPAVRAALESEQPIEAVLQEILGYIATSEGVVPVIGNLRYTLADSEPIYVPRYVATFFALTNVQVGDLVTATRAAHVNIEERTVLTQRLPFARVNVNRHAPSSSSTGPAPRAGILEFVDLAAIRPLADPTATQTNYERQEHHHVFHGAAHPVVVNSLSLFIWVGFSAGRNERERGGRRERARGKSSTSFPYGIASLEHVVPEVGASFSTYSEDESLSRAWKNMVLILNNPLPLLTGYAIKVTAVSRMGAVNHGEPMPSYSFTVDYVRTGSGSETLISSTQYTIEDLYPSFSPLAKMDEREILDRLPYVQPFELGLPGWSRSPSPTLSRSRSRLSPSPRRPLSRAALTAAHDLLSLSRGTASPSFSYSPGWSALASGLDEGGGDWGGLSPSLSLSAHDVSLPLPPSVSASVADEEEYAAELDAQRLADMEAADAAEVAAYEAEEQAAQAAVNVQGAKYGVGCTKFRKDDCHGNGCGWVVGKGCKGPNAGMAAAAPPTGCSKSPKYMCDANEKCKWIKYKGCRVNRDQLAGGRRVDVDGRVRVSGGYSAPLYGGMALN